MGGSSADAAADLVGVAGQPLAAIEVSEGFGVGALGVVEPDRVRRILNPVLVITKPGKSDH